jgi:hypothetical protein
VLKSFEFGGQRAEMQLSSIESADYEHEKSCKVERSKIIYNDNALS